MNFEKCYSKILWFKYVLNEQYIVDISEVHNIQHDTSKYLNGTNYEK